MSSFRLNAVLVVKKKKKNCWASAHLMAICLYQPAGLRLRLLIHIPKGTFARLILMCHKLIPN